MINILLSVIFTFIKRFLVMVIGFVIGWLAGVAFAFTPFSDTLLDGLNILSTTPRFNREHLAALFATLFFFGAFFVKTTLTDE
ncbi:hypothetical protein CN918_31825 [Priestia megaterium]|nr:hypothetical protein CN918_31825 [Priestia megaterium]